MLKLPEERRKWGESTGAGRGRGERRENFFLLSPSPLSFFRPRTYRKGYYFYSPQSSTVIKSKMEATTTQRTRTRFCPPKIRLHCRLVMQKTKYLKHKWNFYSAKRRHLVFISFCFCFCFFLFFVQLLRTGVLYRTLNLTSRSVRFLRLCRRVLLLRWMVMLIPQVAAGFVSANSPTFIEQMLVRKLGYT